jgi:hypothetical protein
MATEASAFGLGAYRVVDHHRHGHSRVEHNTIMTSDCRGPCDFLGEGFA